MNFNNIIEQSKIEYHNLIHDKTPIIMIGAATCGNSAGAQIIKATMEEQLKKNQSACRIIEVGCIGLCYAEPIVSIIKKGKPVIFYDKVTQKMAEELINSYILGDDPLLEHALGTMDIKYFEEGIEEEIPSNNVQEHFQNQEGREVPSLFDLPVLKPQVRRILRNCGFIDPTNIQHYLAKDGYTGLLSALEFTPDEIIKTMEKSGLRGRGGAGFPTWQKWQLCRESDSETKYLICNADEGDPGAFMNRSLLESDPHSVLEGILIAGYVIGAQEAYIYCRTEYPLALKRLKSAMGQMKDQGLLGENILDSGFNFDIKIKEGAGAFVCGEETALIASIEGERGMPRTRPPFPTTSGLWGKPTVINNVETMASVSLIMQQGPEKFANKGINGSKGTKTFSLAGQIKNTGLIEIPLGKTLREVIYDIGGGIKDNKRFKAVQIGGPSGGCIPEKFLDTTIDYNSLITAGAIMGSGGLVVMDENNCMVDVARYFLEFVQNESCGKCVPCRLGTKQMLDILTDITSGNGREDDEKLLSELAEGIKAASLCGLGQSAPNPVLTTLKFFKDEYKAHIEDEVCPALECKSLISYTVDPELCTGCMLCLKSCPAEAVTGEKKETHRIDQDKCIQCGTCFESCNKYKAIKRVSPQIT
ncbi:MAG TPA: NADH-quinone oxidoreductase subunit NuoF [Methanobacterium sp.]|nr:NADH-quinone oxidoreductase subunit NuoF [Methanobacterium sp.]